MKFHNNKAIHVGGWILFISTVLVSCTTAPVVDQAAIPDLDPAIEEVGQSADQVANSAGALDLIEQDVRESADTIEGSADRLDVAADGPVEVLPEIVKTEVPAIKTEVDELRVSADRIDEVEGELLGVKDRLENTRDDLKVQREKTSNLVDQNNTLLQQSETYRAKIDELESENKKLLQKQLNYLIIASTVGIGICFALAIFLRSRVALVIALGLGGILGTAVVVSMYLEWIAYITIAAGVLGLLYLCWTAWKKNKAFDEVVQTGELAKEYMDPEARHYIFGRGPDIGQADLIQSKTTKKLVKQTRSSKDIVNAGDPTPAWTPAFVEELNPGK